MARIGLELESVWHQSPPECASHTLFILPCVNSIRFHRTVTLAMGSLSVGWEGGGQTGVSDSSHLPSHILIFSTSYRRPKALSEAPFIASVGTILYRQFSLAGAISSQSFLFPRLILLRPYQFLSGKHTLSEALTFSMWLNLTNFGVDFFFLFCPLRRTLLLNICYASHFFLLLRIMFDYLIQV